MMKPFAESSSSMSDAFKPVLNLLLTISYSHTLTHTQLAGLGPSKTCLPNVSSCLKPSFHNFPSVSYNCPMKLFLLSVTSFSISQVVLPYW